MHLARPIHDPVALHELALDRPGMRYVLHVTLAAEIGRVVARAAERLGLRGRGVSVGGDGGHRQHALYGVPRFDTDT